MKTIAIIGAGFSGALTAYHLLSQNNVKCKVILIDPSASPGRGIAYGVDSEAFLLNVSATAMSALPQEPEHFINWIRNKGLSYQASDFVPRKIYGDYLEEILTKIGASSARLECKRNLVSKIEKSEKTWKLSCSNGDSLSVDAVVLALGFPRQDFKYLNPHLTASYEGISHCKKIAIIGSGLTAVDVLEECKALGYSGEIVVLSRSGKFPYIHKSVNNTENKAAFLSLLELKQVRLIQALKLLRADIVRYGADTIMHELRPHIVTIWRKLSPRDKQRFFLHLDSRWGRVRHRMPQSSADNIEALKKSGRLKVIKGQFKDSQSQLEVDKIFDCRGPGAYPIAQPLICDMLNTGLIQLSELERGIKTDSKGRASAPESAALFVIGPLRREELLETTAVRELRQQALDISTAVIEGL